MPIPLAVALAPTIAKTGFGIYQTIKGNRDLKRLKRPTYRIPGELQQNVNVAERLAAGGLPDAQKTEYQQALDRSGQLALQGLSSRGAGVGAISNVQAQQNIGSQRLLSMDAQARLRNEQFAMQARNRLALARDKQFDLNELNPYLTKRSEAQALLGAGIQNISGGLDTASGALQGRGVGGAGTSLAQGTAMSTGSSGLADLYSQRLNDPKYGLPNDFYNRYPQ